MLTLLFLSSFLYINVKLKYPLFRENISLFQCPHKRCPLLEGYLVDCILDM